MKAELVCKQLQHQIKISRDEINNLRKLQTNLQRQTRKEVEDIKALLKDPLELKEKTATCKKNIKSSDDKCILDSIRPIGYTHSWFKEKNGTPRQSSVSETNRATITIDKAVFRRPEHALDGLMNFSHIWILSIFHRNESICTKAKVHPPRLDGATVGVFASRSPHRPSPIGLSLSKLERIEGGTLHISGVDLIDGTPVIDIKPYIAAYDAPTDISTLVYASATKNTAAPKEHDSESLEPLYKEASWIHSPPLSQLTVLFTERAEEGLRRFHGHSDGCEFCLSGIQGASEAKCAITDVLKADPRSIYRRKRCKDKLYYFNIDTISVTCWFDDEESVVEVLKVSPRSKCSADTDV